MVSNGLLNLYSRGVIFIKKMVSFKSIIGWTTMTLFFLLCFIIVLCLPIKLFWLYGLFGGFIIIGLIAIFTAQTYIIIDEQKSKIDLVLSPLIDPFINKEVRYNKDNWNNSIGLNDVGNYFIKKISKEEKSLFLGSKFILNKYIVIETLKGSKKYFYVALFTKKQIEYILNVLNKYAINCSPVDNDMKFFK